MQSGPSAPPPLAPFLAIRAGNGAFERHCSAAAWGRSNGRSPASREPPRLRVRVAYTGGTCARPAPRQAPPPRPHTHTHPTPFSRLALDVATLDVCLCGSDNRKCKPCPAGSGGAFAAAVGGRWPARPAADPSARPERPRVVWMPAPSQRRRRCRWRSGLARACCLPCAGMIWPREWFYRLCEGSKYAPCLR